jgi:hypothetical protein
MKQTRQGQETDRARTGNGHGKDRKWTGQGQEMDRARTGNGQDKDMPWLTMLGRSWDFIRINNEREKRAGKRPVNNNYFDYQILVWDLTVLPVLSVTVQQ